MPQYKYAMISSVALLMMNKWLWMCFHCKQRCNKHSLTYFTWNNSFISKSGITMSKVFYFKIVPDYFPKSLLHFIILPTLGVTDPLEFPEHWKMRLAAILLNTRSQWGHVASCLLTSPRSSLNSLSDFFFSQM